MNNKRLFLLTGAVLTFAFTCFLAPVHWIHDWPMWWGLLGGAVTGTLLYFGLLPAGAHPNRAGTIGQKVLMFACMFSVFIIMFYSYFQNAGRIRSYIRENGVVTSGIITGGTAKTTERDGSSSTTYKLTVAFTSGSGATISKSVSIDGSDWAHAGKGMPVTVVYAKQHPEMCRILFSDKDIQQYAPQLHLNRMDFATLANIFSEPDLNQSQYLNPAQGWAKMPGNEGLPGYFNSVTRNGLYRSGNTLMLVNAVKSNDWNDIYRYARHKMTAVYDSLDYNPVAGAVFTAGSLQVRFQKYQREAPLNRSADIVYPIIANRTVFVLGISKKGDYMLLPGDVLANETKEEKLIRLMRQQAGGR